MKKLAIALGLGSVISLQAFAETNVALGKTVTLLGTFYDNPAGWTGSNGAPAASITDGAFVQNQQQWNVGTVWWNAFSYPGNKIQIDLGGLFAINKLTLQADNNDWYRIEYQNQANAWVSLFDMKPPSAWGMTTVTSILPATISAQAFRISDGASGDCCNSVSEFQAFGVAAVPEPETYALMIAGLGLIAGIARRKKHLPTA